MRLGAFFYVVGSAILRARPSAKMVVIVHSSLTGCQSMAVAASSSLMIDSAVSEKRTPAILMVMMLASWRKNGGILLAITMLVVSRGSVLGSFL